MIKINIKFIIFIIFINFIFVSGVLAVSPTVTPKLSPTFASSSATLTPTTTEDENVKAIRDSAKASIAQERIDQIKEKIEKKAYVGKITDITDSTLTLSNFRGKQRVRIIEGLTTIIGGSKKEIVFKDLAVDDKVIALGEPDTNDILEAKRIIVIPAPKTVPAKRLTFFGTISEVNTKTSTLTLTGIKNLDLTLQIKFDKTTFLVNQKDPKTEISFKNLAENQKIVAIYPEPAEAKTAIAKTLFLLP